MSTPTCDRPDWSTYFMGICKAVAARSIDVETKVGSVIVDPNHRIVSTGYNAFPAGVDDAFWPRARAITVKVPHVSVRRSYLGMEPLPATNLKLEDNASWQEQGKFYEVNKYWAMCHAEENAIVASGQDLHRCALYTLLFPCAKCASLIITAGIKSVIYGEVREDVTTAVAKELLIQAGVALTNWKDV